MKDLGRGLAVILEGPHLGKMVLVGHGKGKRDHVGRVGRLCAGNANEVEILCTGGGRDWTSLHGGLVADGTVVGNHQAVAFL